MKGFTGYEGVWFNPQFIFLFVLFFWAVYLNKLSLSKNFKKQIALSLLFILVYLGSTCNNLVRTGEYDYSIRETLRITFSILLMWMFASLKDPQIVGALKSIVCVSVIEIVLGIYGILGVINLAPISDKLNEIASEQVLHSWTTIFDFNILIPKWGVTYPESQTLALFFLISYFSLDLLQSAVTRSWNKILKIYKLVLVIIIIYLASKSVSIALIIYIFSNFITKVRDHTKPLIFAISFAVIILLLFVILSFNVLSITSEGVYAGDMSSLGERLFHVTSIISFINENPTSFLLGLGPRMYGEYISRIYPSIFTVDTNSMTIFTILSDVGIIGFMAGIAMFFAIGSNLTSKLRKMFLCLIIADFTQPDWAIAILFVAIGILIAINKRGSIWQLNKTLEKSLA